MKDFFFDLETYSPTPLKNCTHVYAEKAEVTLWSYALEDGEIRVWDRANGAVHWQDELSGVWVSESVHGMPEDLRADLADQGNLVWGHNAGMFDFVVLTHDMP